jgi:hypothetical protein
MAPEEEKAVEILIKKMTTGVKLKWIKRRMGAVKNEGVSELRYYLCY